MVNFSCFSNLFIQRKKKPQKSTKPINSTRLSRIGDLRIKPEELIYHSHDNGTKETSVVPKSLMSYLHVAERKIKDEISSPTAAAAAEVAYEGGDEHDDVKPMKRDFSDFDLQTIVANNGITSPGFTQEFNHHLTENKLARVEDTTPELLIQSGHVSDPGMKRTVASWGSPSLKRSCSNIETRRSSKFVASPIRSYSCEDLQKLCVDSSGRVHDHLGSPASIKTSGSADMVMLKKRSSRQVLPSRSRKLWWKLFLWSHRNVHKSWTWKREKTIPENDTCNQRGGYCSDTLEPSHKVDMKMKRPMEDQGFKTGFWPQNQWVAFYAESSSLDRVSAWVHSLDDTSLYPVDDEVAAGGAYDNMTYTEEGEPSCRNLPHASRHNLEDVLQANHIVESLNSFSSVAHISGMGLKAIPTISAFNSLRAVNLSGNFIVHISPVSLPKGLHTLDLSRNKIATIEGLRDLAKLRVLNLSYNRISRIGHGLSNCTLLKELYLAGNKISDVEGIHRLTKLIVLDLSFNKIVATKALGQLVDNYNSLLALNLLGNPVQTNIGDDQLRKTVCSLLPHLVYLNKQPTKPLRAREVAIHRIAKAALGDIDWNSRKRSMRRTVSNSSTPRGRAADRNNYKGVGNGSGQKNRQRSKGRHQHSLRSQDLNATSSRICV